MNIEDESIIYDHDTDQIIENGGSNLSNSILIEPERRAKSSFGENSVGRIRNKLHKQNQQQQQNLMQQLRGNSSSAMSRLQQTQQN